MTMIAKFAGTCKACGGRIEPGTMISWDRDRGARHATTLQCNAARTTRPAPVAAPAPVVISMAPVVAFLAGARERGLAAPKVRFLHGARECRLVLAGERSKNPGAVYVKIDGEYQGLVAADGVVRGALAHDVALLDTLRAIVANPAAAAKAYATLMGRCSFCSLPLTDAGSVEAGYGPVCAKRYDLPHTALGTVKATAIAA